LESRLKESIQSILKKFKKLSFGYEDTKLAYITSHNYIPDFTLYNKNKTKIIYVEAKGNFPPADRAKMKAVKKAHPDLDIRFVFQKDNLIQKKSKTTYSMWATKNGFLSSVGEELPKEWLEDLNNA